METPEIIRNLAALRLEEAQILVQNGKPDGAFYLAGYSVELALKAKVAERLGLPGLFDEQNTNQQFAGLNELRRLVKTHNLTLLFVMSGLKAAFDQLRVTQAEFSTAASWLNDWNEGLRYRSPGAVTQMGVEHFISTLGEVTGLLQWIEKH